MMYLADRQVCATIKQPGVKGGGIGAAYAEFCWQWAWARLHVGPRPALARARIATAGAHAHQLHQKQSTD